MASAHSDLLPFELTGDDTKKVLAALMVIGICVSSVVWYYIEEIEGFFSPNMASASSPNTRATESLLSQLPNEMWGDLITSYLRDADKKTLLACREVSPNFRHWVDKKTTLWTRTDKIVQI